MDYACGMTEPPVPLRVARDFCFTSMRPLLAATVGSNETQRPRRENENGHTSGCPCGSILDPCVGITTVRLQRAHDENDDGEHRGYCCPAPGDAYADVGSTGCRSRLVGAELFAHFLFLFDYLVLNLSGPLVERLGVAASKRHRVRQSDPICRTARQAPYPFVIIAL